MLHGRRGGEGVAVLAVSVNCERTYPEGTNTFKTVFHLFTIVKMSGSIQKVGNLIVFIKTPVSLLEQYLLAKDYKGGEALISQYLA
ncbi:MAG: hypothetical protein ACYTXA_29200 [Nostoc sp.]